MDTKLTQVVTNWIDEAKQPRNVRNQALYLGLCLEELAEVLNEVFEVDRNDAVELGQVASKLAYLGNLFKEGLWDRNVGLANQVELMDGFCDLTWVAIGAGHMTGNVAGAFAEVAQSNWSKFQDGLALLDKNGKVIKAASFRAPVLAPFVEVN